MARIYIYTIDSGRPVSATRRPLLGNLLLASRTVPRDHIFEKRGSNHNKAGKIKNGLLQQIWLIVYIPGKLSNGDEYPS